MLVTASDTPDLATSLYSPQPPRRLLLKRSKDVVLRDVLPIKRDLFVLCPMSAVQTAAYERLLLSEDTQWVIDVVIRGVGKGGEVRSMDVGVGGDLGGREGGGGEGRWWGDVAVVG